MIKKGFFEEGYETLSMGMFSTGKIVKNRGKQLILKDMRSCLIRMAVLPQTPPSIIKKLYDLGYKTSALNPSAPKSIKENGEPLGHISNREKRNYYKFVKE